MEPLQAKDIDQFSSLSIKAEVEGSSSSLTNSFSASVYSPPKTLTIHYTHLHEEKMILYDLNDMKLRFRRHSSPVEQ